MRGMNTHRLPKSSRFKITPSLSPFARLDDLVKTAGFWGDVGDGMWNSAVKPIGQALGNVASGVQGAARGVSNAVSGAAGMAGNTLARPFRAIGGMAQGALDGVGKSYTQNGGHVNLGDIGQGAMSGMRNANNQTNADIARNYGQATGGVGQFTNGVGLAGGGFGQAAWGSLPAVMAGRAVMGAGSGAATGLRNRYGGQPQPPAQGPTGAPPPMPQGGGMRLNASTSLGPPAPSFAPPPMPNGMYKGAALTPFAAMSQLVKQAVGMFAPAWTTTGIEDMGSGMQQASRMPLSSPITPAMHQFATAPMTPTDTPTAPTATPTAPVAAPDETDWNARFREETNSAFNPNSRQDVQNMAALKARGSAYKPTGMATVNTAQFRRGMRPGSMLAKRGSVSPFAALELEKSALTGLLQSGVKALGKAVLKHGKGAAKGATTAANNAAANATRAQAAVKGTRGNHRLTAQAFARNLAADAKAAKGVAATAGQNRMDAGTYLTGAAKDMSRISPNVRRGIDIGVPAVGGGAALYGSNRMGHSSGLDEGLDQGFDTGAAYGIQAAQQNAPTDPGVLGRIMSVFTGQEAGPQPAALQALLDSNKSQILKQIRGA